MDRILELITEHFKRVFSDLEIGHDITDKDLCEIWEMVHAYEMLDSNALSLSEQKQILDYYD